MKKILICLLLMTAIPLYPFSEPSIVMAQPAYAKWGRMAMEKTKEKYPKANIVDYEHLGRIQGINTTMERFKLWLKEGDREFGVIVHIEFDKKTERTIKITFKEVER